MTLDTRIIRVTLSMPGGDVIIDQSLNVKVKVNKAALHIQNRASIDVVGLSKSLREQLLSQFTAWNKRLVDQGRASQKWINVKIQAGYKTSRGEQISTIFKGQVVLCEPTMPPPNVGVRITCFTRQIDKTAFVSEPAPHSTTFARYVEWAAGQMGFGANFVCETSYNDVVISNPARSISVVSGLLIDIQSIHRPNVAAFVDDDVLIVKDRNKIINPAEVADIKRFIGIPTWTEWGAEFRCMFDGYIKLAQAVEVTSELNPSLNGRYVVTMLEYELTSRDIPFYVKVNGSPPAQ